jgi:hypothetical protein
LAVVLSGAEDCLPAALSVQNSNAAGRDRCIESGASVVPPPALGTTMYRKSGDRPEYYQQIFVRSHGLFAPFTVRAALALFTLVAEITLSRQSDGLFKAQSTQAEIRIVKNLCLFWSA